MNTENTTLKSIRAIVQGNPPCSNIENFLFKNDCLYLLSKISSGDCAKRLKTQQFLNRVSWQTRLITSSSFLSLFHEKNIQYALFKGAVLSMNAYNDLSYRSSGDLDILISRRDVDIVKKILIDCGFVQGKVIKQEIVPFSRQELIFQSSVSHQIAPFIKATNNRFCPFLNVDINFDIFWGEYQDTVDMEFVLSQVEPIRLLGVETYILCKEIDFIVLCLHAYKDLNSIFLLSKGCLNLRIFSDIYFFLTMQKLDWSMIYRLTKVLRAENYLYYCLYYTYLVFNDTKLLDYMSPFCSGSAKTILNTYGLTPTERKEWEFSFEERLLDENFPIRFYNGLSEVEKNKVYFNLINM